MQSLYLSLSLLFEESSKKYSCESYKRCAGRLGPGGSIFQRLGAKTFWQAGRDLEEQSLSLSLLFLFFLFLTFSLSCTYSRVIHCEKEKKEERQKIGGKCETGDESQKKLENVSDSLFTQCST